MLNNSGSSQIDVRDVYKKIQTGEKDFVLLDVRTPQEYSGQKIASSINLPVDQVSEAIEKIIPDKEKFVYVYCLSGSRSIEAVAIMKDLGYKNAYDMISGLMAWRVYELPLQN